MAQSIRLYVKKQLRLDRLSFRQADMYQIGTAGVTDVIRRVKSGLGPQDAEAKPLSRRYALHKKHRGQPPIRNLTYTGQMLGSLKLRTVSENRAYGSVGADARREMRLIATKEKKYTSRGKTQRRLTNKDVAWANQQREPWLVFSPANLRAVMLRAAEVFKQATARLVKLN